MQLWPLTVINGIIIYIYNQLEKKTDFFHPFIPFKDQHPWFKNAFAAAPGLGGLASAVARPVDSISPGPGRGCDGKNQGRKN